MSGRSRCGGFLSRAVAVALSLVAPVAARAGDAETRDFSVSVGGKVSGEVHMTIEKRDDGRVTMDCSTDIAVKHGFITYKYIYRGSEEWKNQRLTRFNSTTDDNGKRYGVSAVAKANGIALVANNTERLVRADAWPSSYWMLPEAKLRGQGLVIIDADTGKEQTDGKLSLVGLEKRRVGGQEVALNHYRVTGKANIDLWYDGSDRLVRQEWTEQGQKMIVELVRIRRP